MLVRRQDNLHFLFDIAFSWFRYWFSKVFSYIPKVTWNQYTVILPSASSCSSSCLSYSIFYHFWISGFVNNRMYFLGYFLVVYRPIFQKPPDVFAEVFSTSVSSLSGRIPPVLAFSKIFIALLTFPSLISRAKVNASLLLFVVTQSLLFSVSCIVFLSNISWSSCPFSRAIIFASLFQSFLLILNSRRFF